MGYVVINGSLGERINIIGYIIGRFTQASIIKMNRRVGSTLMDSIYNR
jgi:hypothetical protein